MGTAHYFVAEDIADFRNSLKTHHYTLEESSGWRVYSKTLSEVMVKHYSFWGKNGDRAKTDVRVTYELVNDGKPLLRLADQLKKLNWRYLLALPGWKTKNPASEKSRISRSKAVQDFLSEHRELISCFRYPSDDHLGWRAVEFAREIQKELQEGTWNEGEVVSVPQIPQRNPGIGEFVAPDIQSDSRRQSGQGGSPFSVSVSVDRRLPPPPARRISMYRRRPDAKPAAANRSKIRTIGGWISPARVVPEIRKIASVPDSQTPPHHLR